ncbi:glycosyltransferase [Streptococcus pluranimalium]
MVHLSIIIPVYNTPIKKLEKCFASVKKFNDLNSDLEIECLVIDDGSEKVISDWCKKFANKGNIFRFYKKRNEGVSVARNTGIDLSTGNYLMFVDSDDIILPVIDFQNFILLEKMDLIFTDLEVLTKKRSTWTAFSGEAREIEIKNVIERLTIDGTLNGPCGKIIKTEFLKKHNIKFDKEMITGEDLSFLIDILFFNPKMYYINQSSYLYQLDVSTSNNRLLNNTTVFIKNNEMMFKKLINLIDKFIFFETNTDLKKKATERYIKQLFNTSLELVKNGSLTNQRKEEIRNLVFEIDHKTKALITQNKLSKSNFQMKILLNDLWFLLTAISLMRTLYLMFKERL